MRRVRLIWFTAISIALLACAAGGTAAASGPGGSSRLKLGPLRSWGGTEIRSLDPGASRRPSPLGHPGRSPFSGSLRAAHPRASTVLSNERTFTRWASIVQGAPIHRRAMTSSPRVAKLHWYTEDGFPEIYLLLSAHWNAADQEWIRVRIPARPNGQTGWVRRQDLGEFHLTHMAITVSRARLRMYVYDDGHRIWSAPVAVGKPSTPTPAGHFWIRERFKVENPNSGYYPYAFGTSDYSTLSDWPGGGVVGIHGPYYEPQDIPGRVSHGCIRLRVGDDAWLAHHVGLGTPVDVL